MESELMMSFREHELDWRGLGLAGGMLELSVGKACLKSAETQKRLPFKTLPGFLGCNCY